MPSQITIENIEAMRRREGIADVQLLQAIRLLKIGDCVKLTLLTSAKSAAGETLLVRITRIKGSALRGVLVQKPTSAGLSWLLLGFPIAFTPDQIHSIPKERPGDEK